jgi:ABC-type dipeptide/oligopeptide/nickel transport system ATPase subunit
MILQVSNIKKYFGHVKAVDGVGFTLHEGEILCIIGESGCGKSTLAKVLMDLIKYDEGRIEGDRSRFQMVFQDPYSSLDPLWTVHSILKEALHQQELTTQEKEDRMARILQSVGLPVQALSRFPHEFSGGERQRIAIARALLTDPKVLILDEAVSSLDILVQKQILQLLLELKRKYHLTYIFISHNLRVVKSFGDRIAVMKDGKIIETASARSIFDQPQQRYTRQLIQAAFEYTL